MSNLIQKNRFELAGFEHAQVQLYKDAFCKGANDEELFFFMTVCKQTGLDPVKKQIFMVPRYDSRLKKNVFTPQVSVDGLRVIAERSGKYSGQTSPLWCGKDGQWKDVWLSQDYPQAAKVGVYKEGFKEPIYAIAKWDSYAPYFGQNQTLSPMWQKMPDLMLAKCAESLALRKAFPSDSHGLYTKEEMSQANKGGEVESEEIAEPVRQVNEPNNRLPASNGTSRANDLNARISSQGEIRPIEKPTPKQEQLVEPSWEDFKDKKEEQRKNKEEAKNHPFTKQVQETFNITKEPEVTSTCWNRVITAGPMSGKTFKEFYEERGKEKMISMYKASLASINKKEEAGEEVTDAVREMVADLEMCLGELGVS